MLMVASVVFGALIVAILASLKNAQFAQSQTRATKYAQEGLERIRLIKNSNGEVDFNAAQGCASTCGPTNCNFSLLWNCDLSVPVNSPCVVKAAGEAQVGGCYFRLDSTGTKLVEAPDSANITESLEDGLRREIYFKDGADSNEKKVLVKVKWTDSSGEHMSNLETVLANY